MKKLIELLRRLVIALEQANETRERFNEIGTKQLEIAVEQFKNAKQAKDEIIDSIQGISECQEQQATDLLNLYERFDKLEGVVTDHTNLKRHTRKVMAEAEPEPVEHCLCEFASPGFDGTNHDQRCKKANGDEVPQ